MQNQEKIIQAIAAKLNEYDTLVSLYDVEEMAQSIAAAIAPLVNAQAQDFAGWICNQVVAGRTYHKLWLDYCEEKAIAPHLEAGAGLSEARGIIVKVAASLVRQQASEYAEDLDLPKTTPITAIRKFETEAQNWNDRNRLRAIELKRAYDLLK